MKRRKLPSFKEHAEEHHKRTNAYVERHVSRLSEEMVRDTIRTLELLGIDVPKDEALSLMDYPELRQPLANIRKRYARGLETTIVNGAVREWAESNNLQDLFVRRVLKERGQDERAERFIHYFKPNTEARNAFIKRKEQGLGLSDKVWNVSGLMQSNLEQSLATAIEDGWDAVTLSKRVSQYLRDFPTMQRDYRLRYGRASRIEDAEYRSARLARTEINMAYRRAEQSRWADMDFVVGYEIKRSGRGYSCSVCDALAGKYPKDFVWHTWHPNCRCYAVPILNTDDEFFASPIEAKGTNASPSINEVTDTPEGFRSWISTNEHRIVQARERGTLPYFIRHNPKYSTPQKVKRERPKRTPEEAKAIQDRWDKRNATLLTKKAQEVKDEVQGIAIDIARKFGGVVTPINLKSENSILRKLKSDVVNHDIREIKDAVRTTIVVPPDKIDDIRQYFMEQKKRGGVVLRVKVQGGELTLGYTGTIVNVLGSNGLIGEIQINTPKMIYAKEKPEDAKRILGLKVWEQIRRETRVEGGLGHSYYERYRVLSLKQQLSEVGLNIRRESEEYYKHFKE